MLAWEDKTAEGSHYFKPGLIIWNSGPYTIVEFERNGQQRGHPFYQSRGLSDEILTVEEAKQICQEHFDNQWKD